MAVLFALPPDKDFRAADRAAVGSHLSSGTELRSWGKNISGRDLKFCPECYVDDTKDDPLTQMILPKL